jgi:hypothetical protein
MEQKYKEKLNDQLVKLADTEEIFDIQDSVHQAAGHRLVPPKYD